MGSSEPDDRSFDEWKEARSILARYDNNLHDLRKYGFSFITALLAANGILSQTLPVTTVTTSNTTTLTGNLTTTTITTAVATPSTVVTDVIKVGVLMATLGLIVTLRLLDMHYRLFQRAASIQARILENRLNLDITSTISFFYDLGGWWRYVQWLYYGFVGLTFLLGLFILWTWPPTLLMYMLGGAVVISSILIWGIGLQKPTEVVDWSVDRKIVNKGDSVRITFTNLNEKDKDRPWEYILNCQYFQYKSPLKEQTTTDIVSIPVIECMEYLDNYDFLWKTTELEPDLYKLLMTSMRKKEQPSLWLKLKKFILCMWLEKEEEEKEDEKKLSLTVQIIPKAKPDGKVGNRYFII